MPLDVISHQLQFLREDARGRARTGAIGADLGERWPVAVGSASARALQGARRTIPLADGLWDRLELDLAYVLTRHAFWLEAPALGDILADRIARGYRLERSLAEAIANDAARFALSDRPKIASHVSANDMEFLRFVLVACALAHDDEGLTQDLGLGRSFLTHIQRTLAGTIDAATQHARYLPEIDNALARIMMSLASELKVNPWAMEAARLSYQMIGAAEHWLNWIGNNGGSQLFSLLLQIGEAGSSGVTARELAILATDIPGSCDDLITNLIACGLLDPAQFIKPGISKACRQSFRLTPFSVNLTAEAFASRTAEQSTVTSLQSLDESYQAAVIRRLPDSRISLLHELARQDAPVLSPTGTTALLDRLELMMDSASWKALAQLQAERSPSSYVRRAVVRSLAQRGDTTTIERIVNQDESLVVREEALYRLLNAGHIAES